MIKELVTVSSFTVGAAGLVFIGYMQTHPKALTHPIVPETTVLQTEPIPALPALHVV